MLTLDEETALGDLARTGDLHARNRLVEENIGLAFNVARRYWRAFPQHVEDLVGVAVIGLIQAAETFEPARGNFAGHATMKCWGAVTQAVRELRRQQRHERSFVDVEDGRNWDPIATTMDDDAGPVESMLHAEAVVNVRAALRQLPDRERVVLNARFWRGSTLKEAGREVGVSLDVAGKLEKRGLRRLQAVLEGRGPVVEKRRAVWERAAVGVR